MRYQAAREYQEDAGTTTTSAISSESSSSVPFPLSLESPSIGVSKLSSYLSLLPRAAINEDYLNQRTAAVEEKAVEEVIEHKPLRTQLKSDMRVALRSMDPHTSLHSLPFSLKSYKRVLGTQFQFQSTVRDNDHTDTPVSIASAHSRASTSIPSTSAARKLSPSSLSTIVNQLIAPSSTTAAANSLLQYLEGEQRGIILQIINELSMRHAYEVLITVFSTVIEPHADKMIEQMTQMTASNQTPAQVLSFLRSLHAPPLIDRSAGLALSASLAIRQSSVSRRILSQLSRYQTGQARLFERYRWEFSLEVAKGGEKTDSPLSTPNQSDELSAYNPQPYLSFLSTLMKPSSSNNSDPNQPSIRAEKYFRRARELTSHERDELAAARRLRRKARRSARSSSTTDLPQVKPALQLFNRLVDPPAGAGAFPILPWNRVAQDMLHGVGKVCANEARDMLTQGSHAEILRAACEPLQHNLTQHKQDPLDKFSLNDIAATLNEIASRKQEALDLVAGISSHILQSFIANRTVKIDHDAAAAAQTSTAPATETDANESSPAEDNNPNPEVDPTSSVKPSIQSTPVIPPTTAASNHHMWRLVKLFLGSSQSTGAASGNHSNNASTSTPSHSFTSSHPAIGASYTQFADSASTSLAQVLNQRMHIRRALTDVFPAAFTADMFRIALTETQQKRLEFNQQRQEGEEGSSESSTSSSTAKFSHTSASARAAQELVELSQLHLRLLHTVLEAYIRLAKDFAALEAAGEKLRVRAEYRVLAEESALAAVEAREAELGTGEEDASASRIASHEAITAVRQAAYPATTLGPVQTLLAYAANECIQFTPHTLTLLFHKGLFGGGIRSSVRYQSTHPTTIITFGESKFQGSEEADLRVAFRILDSCGPSFRRIPSKNGGANSDILSSILIDHLLPKPFTLHDTVAASKTTASSMRQPHNKLFESFSTAILNVLEKQRRRLSREEGFQRKRTALQEESVDLYSASNAAKPASSSSALAGLAARFPFSLVRDQSGLLSRLLSEMEFIHSRPEWKALETQAYLNSGLQAPRLQSQFLTRIGKGSGAPIPNESAAGRRNRTSGKQSAELADGLYRMRSDTVLRGVNSAFNQKEVASWRERDHTFFGKNTSPYVYNQSLIESPLQQVPNYAISRNLYSSLLAYYDRCNNLPAAMVLLDRMRFSWSTPSLTGAGAMLNLSLKYMNYELVGSVMSEYVLSLADSSPKKRRVWRQLLEGMRRFNSYSNVDSYMKYLHHLVRNYLEPTIDAAKGINAGSNEEHQAALTATAVKSDMDSLWTAWVARGGAAEVLKAWQSILQHSSAAKLDDASITAFLNGLVRSSKSGFDATQPLQSEQILTSVELLLRFVATANHPSLRLTPVHKELLSLHIPIFLAQLRGVSHRDALVDSIDGGSASFFAFCSENNIPSSVARAVIDNNSQQVTNAADSSATSKDLSMLTPSGLRAHVVSTQLSELNASFGSAGVDYAISKLEKILAKSA